MRMWEVEAIDHWRCSIWETLWPCQPLTPSRPSGGRMQRSEAQQCGHPDRREGGKSCRPSLDAREGTVYTAQETARFSDWCMHAC